MRLAAILLVVVGGLIIGLATAWVFVERGAFSGVTTRGVWMVWPEAGDPDANPYAAAAFANSGRQHLGAAEGVEFVAVADNGGVTLDPACTYVLAGRLPAARFTTVTVTDGNGNVPQSPTGRFALAQPDLLRDADGTVTIRLSPQAEAGNWIPTTGLASLRVTVRLYGTGWAAVSEQPLPTLSRERCP